MMDEYERYRLLHGLTPAFSNSVLGPRDTMTTAMDETLRAVREKALTVTASDVLGLPKDAAASALTSTMSESLRVHSPAWLTNSVSASDALGVVRNPITGAFTIGSVSESLRAASAGALTVSEALGVVRDPATNAFTIANESLRASTGALTVSETLGVVREPATNAFTIANESLRASAGALTVSEALGVVRDPASAHYLSVAATALPMAPSLELFRPSISRLEASLLAPQRPWLDLHGPESLTAFNSLSAISNALRDVAPFGTPVTNLLRDTIGDWRGVPDLDAVSILNETARRGYYAEHGLDIGLVRFPGAAFPEVLRGVGALPPQSQTDDASDLGADDETAVDVATFEALRPFEVGMRRFLQLLMEGQFGTAWVKQRVSGPTRERWEERRARAMKDGEEPLSLLDYADLMDCAEIIIRGDNWRELFEGIFVDKDEVVVSFRRLNAVRRPLVHGRPIAKEDLLLVTVEVGRLRRAVDTRSKITWDHLRK